MKNPKNHQQEGSIMLESLIAILIFSFGILALVALLGASVKNSSSAVYRTQASLLASQLIGEMWTGDKSNAALIANYQGSGPEAWRGKVIQALPGVTDATAGTNPPGAGQNLPVITVAADNTVTITISWQAPGDTDVHKYVAVSRITSSDGS
jgi:type IV pilus assembly protein PilV